MLSKETLERYRQMTTAERASVFAAAMRQNWRAFLHAGEETNRRRCELIRMQNDERNELLLRAFARTRDGRS